MSDKVDYAASPEFADYACTNCGKENVKLWRRIGEILRRRVHDMLCAGCVCRQEKVNPRAIDAQGFRTDINARRITCLAWRDNKGRTDVIGDWMPAVPAYARKGKVVSFYALRKGPQWAWWRALPLQ